MVEFSNVFPLRKPIIGMIHLAGNDSKDKIKRAIREMEIYDSEHVNGVIIEDYHGDIQDICNVLKTTQDIKFGFAKGVNVLKDPCLGFEFASQFGAQFVQFDSLNFYNNLDWERYCQSRKNFSDIAVLGGVRFKYQPPSGKSLEQDIADAQLLCEAIVTTGEGTGKETPLDKLKDFKSILGDFPLIVGAGVNIDNLHKQMEFADGAIIGSGFKYQRDTHMEVGPLAVRNIMTEMYYSIRSK